MDHLNGPVSHNHKQAARSRPLLSSREGKSVPDKAIVALERFAPGACPKPIWKKQERTFVMCAPVAVRRFSTPAARVVFKRYPNTKVIAMIWITNLEYLSGLR